MSERNVCLLHVAPKDSFGTFKPLQNLHSSINLSALKLETLQDQTAMLRSISKPAPGHRQRMRYSNQGLNFLYRKAILILSTLLILFGSSHIWTGMMGQQISQSDDNVVPCDPPHVQYKLESSSSGGVLRYAAYHKVMASNSQCDPSLQPLTIEGWTNYMSDGNHGDRLSMELTDLLKACSFQAFRFETKGTNAEGIHKVHFEFAIVNDDYLHRFASDADPHTFADQFQGCPDDPNVCVFANLGGDAMLVSPKNLGNGDKDRYGHIAAFLRKAPTEQIQSVWKTVIRTYREQLLARSPEPVWFSAAGGGVAWLHFRFDKRPKYYHYIPFKQIF